MTSCPPARGLRLASLLRAMATAVLLSALGSARPLAAVQPAAASPKASDSTLTISLVTFGPGRQVWERFGHNAIWVRDPSDGTDVAYNYGLFDFHQHNFVLRFIQGRMWYWMDGFPGSAYARVYRRDNRSVWVQELDLPLERRQALRRFLEWNALPEHRYYHYDYYRDNCSTRVRDAVDWALGGRLRAATESAPAGTSYRFHTQRLTANDPLVYSGLLLALGPGVDRPISRWEEAFLPMSLRDRMRELRVRGPDGRMVPVVKTERTYFLSSEPMPPNLPPRWTARYFAAGFAAGVILWLLAAAGRRSRPARLGFATLATAWAAVTGLAGLIMAGLWAATDHVMAYRNENLLQMSPLALALAIVIWAAVRGRPGPVRWSTTLAAGLVLMSLLGLGLKATPGDRQVNGSIIALAFPINLAVLGGLIVLTRRPAPTASVQAREPLLRREPLEREV